MMNKILDDYLEKIDKYLKPMPVSERIDIVKEIKSEMHELETQNALSAEEIIEKLGNPEELAKAYLGENIAKDNSFSFRKIGAVVGFYSLTGLGSMFVLPFAGCLSIGFMAGGVIALLGGFVKLIGFILGFDVPYVIFQIGSYTAPPLIAFPLAVVTGILMFCLGKGTWNLMIKYIRLISRQQSKLAQLS